MERQAAFFLCLFGGCLCLTACHSNDLKKVEEVIAAGSVPTEVSTEIDLVYTDSARLKAHMTAPVMIRYLSQNDPRTEMPKGLHVDFYDVHGKPNSELKADYGIRYTNKNLTKVTGDVHVVNIKGDTLNTEELYWDELKERVYSKKFVKVKTKEETILAEGFESDVNFTKYTFYKIRGILSVKQ